MSHKGIFLGFHSISSSLGFLGCPDREGVGQGQQTEPGPPLSQPELLCSIKKEKSISSITINLVHVPCPIER